MAEGEEAVGTGMGDGDDGGSTAQTHYVGMESRLRARIAELEEENDVLALCATEVNRQDDLRQKLKVEYLRFGTAAVMSFFGDTR